ncbi:MAG TPA: hypothetical protein GXX28_05860 [Firmicutes bacterium]|nr:hypothetical protein [Bacillota bacterium]
MNVDGVAYARAGIFGPGGVGFWVFLLILALLGIYWAWPGAWGVTY